MALETTFNAIPAAFQKAFSSVKTYALETSYLEPAILSAAKNDMTPLR